MTFRHEDVFGWMRPWPIRFSKPCSWSIRFLTLKQSLRFKSYWQDERGKRISAGVAAKRIKARNWLMKDHQIGSAARVGLCAHRPVILVWNSVIVDGNHTLLALERRRYKGRIMVIEATK